MLISTFDRTLHILQIINKTPYLVTYICRDMEKDEEYVLNGFLQPETYQKLIPIILEQGKIYFTDFAEYFSSDGIFYLMFRFQKGKPLIESCQNLHMLERLEYSRRLIEQIILQDMPLIFQYEVLLPENILITEDENVRFYYKFSENLGQKSINFHDIELRLLEILKNILGHELDMQYSDKLLELCQNLKNGGVYQVFTDIYSDFIQASDELKNQKGELISKKYRFKLWESLKKNFEKIWKWILILAILASTMLIFFEMFEKPKEDKSDIPITQIGTLIIRENQPAYSTTVTKTGN